MGNEFESYYVDSAELKKLLLYASTQNFARLAKHKDHGRWNGEVLLDSAL